MTVAGESSETNGARAKHAGSANLLRLSHQWRVDVLFENRALLAINKPSGLIAAPESWSRALRD